VLKLHQARISSPKLGSPVNQPPLHYSAQSSSQRTSRVFWWRAPPHLEVVLGVAQRRQDIERQAASELVAEGVVGTTAAVEPELVGR
jgi:hypothetical protein